MNLYLTFMVILVTVGVAFWLGWVANRGAAELDRIRLIDQLDQATANVQLPRAGYLPGPVAGIGYSATSGWQYVGNSDRVEPAPVPWDLAGAAYALGQQRADQDDVTREVNAIFAEIEGNPAKWRHG